MRHVCQLIGVFGLLTAPACYRPVPIESAAPPVGKTISFLISDRGRVGLGDRLGASVARVEGRIVETVGEEYVVNVFRVADINGKTSTWSGETVRLDRTYVERLQARQLNKGRTWLLAAGVTTVVVVLIASRGLNGLFQGDDDPPGGTDPPDVRRARPAFQN